MGSYIYTRICRQFLRDIVVQSLVAMLQKWVLSPNCDVRGQGPNCGVTDFWEVTSFTIFAMSNTIFAMSPSYTIDAMSPSYVVG
jgi:hypothetical protein